MTDAEAREQQSDRVERRRRTRPQRVLVVDDYEPLRELWSEWLRRWGFEVDVAENGEEGVALARARRPLFIVMDMTMPVLNGVNATRILKQDAMTAHIPVLAVSADVGAPRQQALAAGCAVFLEKPVRAGDLLSEIRNVLRTF